MHGVSIVLDQNGPANPPSLYAQNSAALSPLRSLAENDEGLHCPAADVGLEQGGADAAKVLAEMPPERAPWILYMQPDTIIDDIAFTFPFEMYQGKDWVSVGSAESLLQGWAHGEASANISS